MGRVPLEKRAGVAVLTIGHACSLVAFQCGQRVRRGKRRSALRVVSARQVSPSGCGAAAIEETWARVAAAGVQQ